MVERIPGHALHEKGLQRQIGVGTLVSTQERKALFVPLVNRGFCSSVGSKYELYISFFRRDVLEGKRQGCLLAGLTQQCPVLPSPAPPPRHGPPRPERPVVCPGFGFDTFFPGLA